MVVDAGKPDLVSEFVKKLKREKYYGRLTICFEEGRIVSFDQRQTLKMKDLAEIVKK